ncbi:cuticle protein CP1158-like isoform X2 [Penaeus japonicus]|uniref:cuticle protein CP1158-like isoform X1 n=1 Tax=Penaeus japonicus TaxID=27405 RepID=UPI001C70BF08|nr:cuticle protein CP1158-like isoform X1 [Penaeus japonicus]XP_042872862.1 cuticle protein CP1158-like isoform X2 [Penaeus japonicus]
MKVLVLLAAVVACVSGASINAGWVLPAGNIGTSGILRKDGSTDLFSHDFAHRIVAIGPSGIILEDGSPVQLDADLNMVGRSKRSAGYVSKAGSIGFSGIVRTDGTIDQFGHDMAHNIAVMGPSGIVLKNGQPIQLDENLRMVGRSKRHVVGDTGMITDWGQIIQFREPFTKIVSDGPSGIVLSDGQNIQKPAQ